MDKLDPLRRAVSRRHFLSFGKNALGTAALGTLLGETPGFANDAAGGPLKPHYRPKAKHIIYLHMVGGPSQVDLFDYKPQMQAMYDKDLPDSVRQGQRLTTMTSGQARFPIAPSKYKFNRCGQNGMTITELLPWFSKVSDDVCFIKSMSTEAINHEPAICYIQTGNQVPGRPCLGAWTSYGLGSLNRNLPTFVVLVATPTNRDQEQAISARLWSSGFLSGEHAGVSFRGKGDPILYINNPPGVPDPVRRATLDGIKELNEHTLRELGDPETDTRISQYEMAYRMQTSVPELTAIQNEPEHTYKLYGEEAKKPGSFANSVLLARRLVERGTRFVQIYLNNWDHHGNLTGRMSSQCKDIDQACYGLITDLKQRGMLEDTIVLWGGEFGRTIYSQGGLSRDNYGRDHHPRCFTWWCAGGGFKGGAIHGETDDFSYNIVKDQVKMPDFQATVLHLLGFDHQRLTVRWQGLDARLTGVEPCEIIRPILA